MSIGQTRSRRSVVPGRRRAAAERPTCRRGTVYIAVLGVSMIVVVMALGAVLVIRVQARMIATSNDAAEARLYAISATELGRLMIAQDPSWRYNRSNGTWLTNQPIGAGTCSLDVVNPNGPLNNSDTDPVILTGTGVKGQARQKIQATLAPSLIPLTCLRTAMTVNSTLLFNGSTTDAAGQTMASNASVDGGNAKVYGDVEAVGTINVSGGSFYGRTTSGVAPRTMPSGNVFDYYRANGTNINIAALPLSSGTRWIWRRLISPASNPFGGTNAQGIYVIDCQNQKVIISDSRIVGTLALLNVGAGSSVQGSVNWAPAVSNYPCLLVGGNMSLPLDSTARLSESTSPQTNFNPPGTPYPYPGGVSNTTMSDSYPVLIAGAAYVTGNVSLGNSNPTFCLLIVGGVFDAGSANLRLLYDSTYYRSPPPGFYTVQMPVQSGSWKQSVN